MELRHLIRKISTDIGAELLLHKRALEARWNQVLTVAATKQQSLEDWTNEIRSLYTDLRTIESLYVNTSGLLSKWFRSSTNCLWQHLGTYTRLYCGSVPDKRARLLEPPI